MYKNKDEVMITQFIESNFETAMEKIQNDTYDLDEKMVSSIKLGKLDVDMVKSWMSNYNLLRGIKAEPSTKIANEFIIFAKNNKGNELDIEIKFQELHSKFQKIENRKWISATSKLLWCIDPNNVVIYDSFVERAIGTLQCLDENLAKYPRLNSAPDVKKENDSMNITKYYMNYQNLVKEIMNSNRSVIQRLKEQHKSNDKYMYDVRIIDKLLWIMGNSKSKFKYNNTTCKPSE